MDVIKIKNDKIDKINQKKKRLQILKYKLNNIEYDKEKALGTYIFKLDKNDTFNYHKLSKITSEMTEEERIYLLKWIVFRIKKLLPKYNRIEGENYNPSFKFQCGEAGDLASKLLKKLEIGSVQLNMRHILKAYSNIHAITIATFRYPLEKYVIDPTFRQFLVKEECVPPKINIYKYGKTVDGAEPGYFLNLTKEGREFGIKLLNDGYFKLTEENFKLYCDAFMMSENCLNFRDVDFCIRSGREYIKELDKCNRHITYNTINEIKMTPKQLYEKNKQKENKILLKKKLIK